MLNRTIISSKPAPFPKARFLAFLSRLKIQTKDFGMVAMQPLGTQTYVLDEMCAAIEAGVTTFLILKARQLGMTTFFIALDLFWAMDHPGLLGSFVTHTDQAKANFRNMIKIFFAHLPKSHRIRWDQENRDMIVLKNGSLLQYLVAGTKEKVKGGLGRSSANNYIHATEVAFWGSPDDLNELAPPTPLIIRTVLRSRKPPPTALIFGRSAGAKERTIPRCAVYLSVGGVMITTHFYPTPMAMNIPTCASTCPMAPPRRCRGWSATASAR